MTQLRNIITSFNINFFLSLYPSVNNAQLHNYEWSYVVSMSMGLSEQGDLGPLWGLQRAGQIRDH